MQARIEISVGLQYYLILGRNFVHLLSILVWNLWHCLVQLRAGTCLLAILDATHREVVRTFSPLFSLGSQNDFLQHRASLALYRSPLERNRLDIWHISYLFLNLVSKNPLPNAKLVKHPLPNARKSVYVIIVL